MDTAKALRLLSELASFGPAVRVLGGEPLLHPEWDRIVGEARALGMRCAIVTNGQRLAAEADRVVRSGATMVCVSLDGLAEVHDRGRGRGSHARAVAGIAELSRAKAARRRADPTVVVYTTVSDLNAPALLEFVESLVTLPVDGLQLQHLIWASPRQLGAGLEMVTSALPGLALFGPESEFVRAEPPRLDVEELMSQLDLIMRRRYPFPVWAHPDLPPDELRRYLAELEYERSTARTCTTMERYGFVDPSGRLYPCLTLEMGNVFEQPFVTIWNNRRFRAFRRLVRGQGRLPFCHRCPDVGVESSAT
jgi:MoaA/NifB/PqqE/SkfB family radical SAM enzyme